jgi:hypothetical protein
MGAKMPHWAFNGIGVSDQTVFWGVDDLTVGELMPCALQMVAVPYP